MNGMNESQRKKQEGKKESNIQTYIADERRRKKNKERRIKGRIRKTSEDRLQGITKRITENISENK